MLKKNTQNYYTVEQMKANYENLFSNEMQKVYSQEETSTPMNLEKEKLNKFIDILKDTIQCDKITFSNDCCTIEINKKINMFEQNKILDLINPYIVMDIFIGELDSKTIIKISEEVDYCK